MGCLKWILTSPLLFGATLATAAPSWTAATSFFRSREAQFPSGQVARPVLEKGLLREEQELFFDVRWNGVASKIPIEDGIIDLFCAREAVLQENLLLLKEPRREAASVASLKKDQTVEVIELRRHWMRVKAGAHEGWVLWSRLKAKNEDLGAFLPIVDTFLRQSPSHDSKVLTTLPRGSRLISLGFDESGWMKIKTRQFEGYVDLQHLAGRSDFAAWAWEKDKGWFLASHREGAFLKTKDDRKVPLSKILGYAPFESRLIVSRTADPKRLPVRAHAEILNVNITSWAVSDISGHGEVWWRKDLTLLSSAEPRPEILTTEQLLARPVFSYAIAGTKNIQGLASSKGIWKTTDGRFWQKIKIFGDQELPVAIHPKGAWLVGTHRSFDGGQTFENSIRWDEFARSIEQKIQKTPSRITLRKLDILPNSEIQIQIDTDGRRVSLRSVLDSNSWR